MTFESSWLWRTAFVKERSDASTAEQTFFAERYRSLREKAGALVSRISSDLPDMTVHDLTHLDALWEMASIVAKGSVDLNPPEAFVFGGAVLLHDAAMTLCAYSDGLVGLRRETAWQDAFARLRLAVEDGGRLAASPEKLADAEALRKLHARQAEALPTMSWSTGTGHVEHLIDDPEVRRFYGPKIGRIAHSHWWPIARVEEELSNDLGPLGGRTGNRIDLVKIACLLRVADAMHLDRRRAPAFLRALLNPAGVSSDHWAFQERMAVPYVEAKALVYSAAPAFDVSVAEAWWLAYDAVNMVSRELRGVDLLLQKRGSDRLLASRVEGADLPTDLARYVETEGWSPVDSTVRVSDVPKIVSSLGGSKLYGDNPRAALRELVQNAADAVLARRQLQRRGADWGTVTVSIERRSEEHWLVVQDDGIGMSPAVLTGPLIDFGNSFWRSPMAAEELPGLQAGGIAAVGKYGIGFFSVFMLGQHVRVTSRRYNMASDTIRSLEFRNGLGSRPILYDPNQPDLLPDGGTRVEVLLETDPKEENGLVNFTRGYQPGSDSRALSIVLAALAPAVPVRLVAVEDAVATQVVSADDWLTMHEPHLLARVAGADPKKIGEQESQSRLRPVVGSEGQIFGRAMIETTIWGSQRAGCLTVGGLRASELSVICGVLTGRETTAARNEAEPLASGEAMAAWATEQAALLEEAQLDEEDKARGAMVVLLCGGDICGLPMARLGGKWLSKNDLASVLQGLDTIDVFTGQIRYDEDVDDVHPRDFSHHFEEAEDVLFVPDALPGFGSASAQRILAKQLPAEHPATLISLVIMVIKASWGHMPDEGEANAEVGRVNGETIRRDVTSYWRVDASAQ